MIINTAIDLFAGIGGFTQAAEQAGVRVLWAANHWPAAVQFHAANHPDVEHSCQDLHQANWAKVPTADLLMASPACNGHTHARGKDRPHHDLYRSTAWAVVSCLEFHRMRAFIVENVPAFLRWSLYPSWADAVQRLGYCFQPLILDAADFGVPQNRTRLFIVGQRSNQPIVRREVINGTMDADVRDLRSSNRLSKQLRGPQMAGWSTGSAMCRSRAPRSRVQSRCSEAINSDRDGVDLRESVPLRRSSDYRGLVVAADIIDFDAGNWSAVIRPGRSPKTIERWRRGRAAFGDRFIMPYYSSGSGLTGRALDRPFGTITTRDRWAVVDRDRMRMCMVEEYRRAMAFPDDYTLPDRKDQAVHMLGNAVPPPVPEWIINQLRMAA